MLATNLKQFFFGKYSSLRTKLYSGNNAEMLINRCFAVPQMNVAEINCIVWAVFQ